MTLRTTESEFTKELFGQMAEEPSLDLTLDGPIMDQLHPRLISTKLQHSKSPENIPDYRPAHGWNYACFESLSAAETAFPGIKIIAHAKPWQISRFLEDHSPAIFGFPPLGFVVLSREMLPYKPGSEIHHHLLPVWLEYALSPELWGNSGKWPQFHRRLVDLFSANNLLNKNYQLGYYPLTAAAEKIKNAGFRGTNISKSYVVVLPWTFSLSSLEKLERYIQQEF